MSLVNIGNFQDRFENCFRGKSGLRMAAQGVTPLGRKARTSGTERMSRAMIFEPGTGGS